MIEQVKNYIETNGPLDVDDVDDEFGQAGLDATRELMRRGEVGFNINWDLQVQDPVEHEDLTYIQAVQRSTHEWRQQQFNNLAPIPQTMGTMVEVAEFGGMLVKALYYDEDWADEEKLMTEAGDVILFWLGVLSLLDYDVIDCIEAALDKNAARDWEEHMKAP